MEMKSGSYTGNGSTPHALTFPGTAMSGIPDVVIVIGPDDFDQNITTFATSTMPSGKAKRGRYQENLLSNLILSLDSNGFTVGNGADNCTNKNTKKYYYIAIKDNLAGDFAVFNYTGNGSDNRQITTVGDGCFVFVTSEDATERAVWRSSSMTAADASDYINGQPFADNMIQALNSTGIQIGTSSRVNSNTKLYHGFVMQAVAGASTAFNYTGNGTDNHAVTGVGFAPNNVILFGNNNTGLRRMKDETGDNTLREGNSEIDNRIQSLDADGFTLGSDASCNFNGATFYTVCLADVITVAPPEYTPYRDLTREIDPADWGGTVTVLLEVQGEAPDGTHPLQARLYNVTDSSPVTDSDVTITATSVDRQRSISFSFASGAKVYRVEWGGVPGATYDEPVDAALIVDVT